MNGKALNHHPSCHSCIRRLASIAESAASLSSYVAKDGEPVDIASHRPQRSNNSWLNCPVHLHKNSRLAILYARPRPHGTPPGPFSRWSPSISPSDPSFRSFRSPDHVGLTSAQVTITDCLSIRAASAETPSVWKNGT